MLFYSFTHRLSYKLNWAKENDWTLSLWVLWKWLHLAKKHVTVLSAAELQSAVEINVRGLWFILIQKELFLTTRIRKKLLICSDRWSCGQQIQKLSQWFSVHSVAIAAGIRREIWANAHETRESQWRNNGVGIVILYTTLIWESVNTASYQARVGRVGKVQGPPSVRDPRVPARQLHLDEVVDKFAQCKARKKEFWRVA